MVAPPVVADGVAYLGDRDGHVYALDARTGEVRWRYDHQETKYNEILGPPVVVGDLLLVDVDEWMFAHDRATGAIRWSIIDAGIGATVAGGKLVAVSSKAVNAWDLATLEPLWRRTSLRGLLNTHPVAAGDLMICPLGFEPHHTHGGLRALSRHTGYTVWEVDEQRVTCDDPERDCDEDALFITPFHVAVAGDTVWTTRRRDHPSDSHVTHDLVGFDAESGAERASLPVDGYVMGAVATDGETLYVPTGTRLVAAGAARWTASIASQPVGAPIVAGGVVHLATEDGSLHAFDAATGSARWTVTLDAQTGWADRPTDEYFEPVTPFTLAGGLLYVNTDSAVVALG